MIFKPMKKEDVLAALEGHENILAPAIKAHEAYFRHLACISCGSDVMPFVNPKQLFKKGGLLPNFLARCKTCGVEFEPETKIQLNAPVLP